MITLDWKTIQKLETHLVDFILVKNVYKLIFKTILYKVTFCPAVYKCNLSLSLLQHIQAISAST